MKVSELIEKLSKLPQEATIMKESFDGCSECNPEGFGIYHEIFHVEFKEHGDYPNDETNLVVL